MQISIDPGRKSVLPKRKQVHHPKEKDRFAALMNKDIQLFKKKIKDKKKEEFYAELSILLKSGADLRTALEIILSEQNTQHLKITYNSIYEFVMEGNSLSDSLQKTGYYSSYEYHSIRIGEETGNLVFVLVNLRDYYKKRIKLKRSIINAISYPTMVVCTAILAIVFMLNFIVPMFEDVFNRFEGELPPLTQAIIAISNLLSQNIYSILFFFFSFIILAFLTHKKMWFKRFSSALLLKTPYVGDLFKKIYLTRFCQSMSMLLSSQISMLMALQLVKKMINFLPFETVIEKIEHDVYMGLQLHASMEKHPIFGKKVVALTKVAEEVNQLDSIFNELAQQYSDDVEYQTGLLNNFLEPLMILIVGGLVAVILIAMYLPLFQLSTSFMG